MATQKPTVFFVHGAWHQSAHFDPIVQKLEAAGYPAICPTQPTFNRSGADLQTLTMQDDADFIRKQLQQLIEVDNREVIVVLHSYGGVVGTQAVDASLGVSPRAAHGKKGGVIGLVYMCAFVLPLHASLGDAFGGALPPFINVLEDGSCVMADPRMFFYSGLDDATAQRFLALTRPHVAKSQLTPVTHAAYMHHPVTYILTTKDVALPPEYQRKMIESLRENGLEVTVHEIEADHSPHLSKETEIIGILQKLADRNTGSSIR